MFSRSFGAPLVLLATIATGCLVDGPQVPASIVLDAGTVTFDAIGATQQLTATVLDQDGSPIADATVHWSTGDDQVAIVNANGLVTAMGNGGTQITATVDLVTGQTTVTVQQTPAQATAASGNAQMGTAGSALGDPVVVRITDRLDQPIQGVAVTFAVTGGGGSVDPTADTTGVTGEAAATWTLGPAVGSNTLEVTIGGIAPVSFTATAMTGPPATVAAAGGDGQTATVDTPVSTAPSVIVTDAGGRAVEDVTVTFQVATGGGSVTEGTQTTDATGTATVGAWRLGQTAGQNTLTATVSGLPAVPFAATGEAGPATNLAIADGDGQSASVNTDVAVPPAVLVTDAFANPVAGESVAFVVTVGGGMVSGSPALSASDGIAQVTAWTLGPAEGANALEAAAAATGPVTFNATGTAGTSPGSVMIADGDGQTGLVSTPVNFPPAVQLLDAAGNPVAGVEVVFAPTSGGGSVTSGTIMTDANGTAAVGGWTLGPSAGAHTLTATVTGSGITNNPITFTATAVTATFDIEVRHVASPTASQQAAFDNAVARWEQLLIGDLTDVDFTSSPVAAGACGVDHPQINEVVDDLIIYAELEPIDGPGSVLGSAGPCIVRSGGGLTIVGIMRFDTDDLDGLESSGQLEAVILHEMGHVLGLGTLWGGFLQNPSLPNSPGVDTHFDGATAIKAFDLAGGTDYGGGAKVPVENEQGGQGTRDAHWRESVFDTELMTGFLDSGANQLSIVTVGSFGDIGYLFSFAGTDEYATPAPMAAAVAGGHIELVDDLWFGPLWVVDAVGRVTRSVR